jgi:hypothetical protein
MITDQHLGYTARDLITGFTGAIVGHCKYISGCNQALLVPKVNKDGTGAEGRWVDVQRLELQKDKPITLHNGETPGCDMPAPIR